MSDPINAQGADKHNEKHELIHVDGPHHEYGADGNRRVSILGVKSPGVARIEALASQLTTVDRFFIFFGVFLIAYAYGLDGTVRYTYQSYATNGYGQLGLLATVNVLRGVIAAAAQPTAAKVADVFGRLELVAVSVFFYTLGTVVEASAPGLKGFCAGSVLYQVGYTSILLLVEVIIADITSMRTRVVFSYISAAPFIINAWISGNVTNAVLKTTTWRWGVGMWTIIYPVCALPLMVSLFVVGRRARRNGALDKYSSPFQLLGARRLSIELFWQLDVIGIVLLIAVFALILVPLTLAGGQTAVWQTAHVIAPLVIGFLCIPAFIFWEARAKHPLVPFGLLKDRGVWAALGIATFLNFAWYCQGDYLYTVLVVAFDFDIMTATRVSSLYSFCSVVVGILLGLVIVKVRRLKYFIVAGTALFMVAFGLLIRYRGGSDGSSKSGVIGAQVLLGIAGGMFPYPAQASIQAATIHEHVAVITGLYLALYSIGSALGSCVSGSIYTQVLFKSLEDNLAPLGNASLAAATYASPLTVVLDYPVGTPERTAMIVSYQHVQKILTITGLCLCIPLIVFALLLRNPKLSDQQSQPEAEKDIVVR